MDTSNHLQTGGRGGAIDRARAVAVDSVAVVVDPIVVMLAVALATRTPVSAFGAGGESRAGAHVADATVARPREAMARLPRPKNRKG